MTTMTTQQADGRILRADARWLIWLSAIATGAVIAMSFALSFSAQRAVAIAAHLDPTLAGLMAGCVDGAIVVFTVGTLVLSNRGRAVAAWTWAQLILFGGLSIWTNAIHATGRQLTETEMMVVGAIPALSLLTATHTLTVTLSSARRAKSDAQVQVELEAQAARAAAEERRIAAEARRAEQADRRAGVAPAPRLSTARPATGSRAHAAAVAKEHHAANGEWPARAVLVSEGFSETTAKRGISDAKAAT